MEGFGGAGGPSWAGGEDLQRVGARLLQAVADVLLTPVVAQIPPAPPRPDFDASREKLQKLGEGEGSMTKEEFTKMKQELEA